MMTALDGWLILVGCGLFSGLLYSAWQRRLILLEQAATITRLRTELQQLALAGAYGKPPVLSMVTYPPESVARGRLAISTHLRCEKCGDVFELACRLIPPGGDLQQQAAGVAFRLTAEIEKYLARGQFQMVRTPDRQYYYCPICAAAVLGYLTEPT